MNSSTRALCFLLVAGCCFGGPLQAQPPDRQFRGESDAGLDKAVSLVRERTGGRVLSAETRMVDGRPTHIVRILTKDGKVLRFRSDAATGRIIEPGGRR